MKKGTNVSLEAVHTHTHTSKLLEKKKEITYKVRDGTIFKEEKNSFISFCV